jgi:16S rRNA processing protein RimM
MSAPIIIGSFGKTFGVRGWLKVNSFTHPKRNILDFGSWLIKKGDFWREIIPEDSCARSKDIIAKLPGCNSPEEARCFTNIKIAVWQNQLPKLRSDEYYWRDLIGLRVFNLQNIDFGFVKDLISTGANDVLVVLGDRKRLIPYLSSVIIKVDLEEKKIMLDWQQDW